MPILKDERKIIKLTIKSIEGSEVTVRDGLLGGDMEKVYGGGTMNDIQRTLIALSVMIVDWNLTDNAGKILPVTIENIKKLNITDLTELISSTSFGDKKKEQTLKN